MKNLFFLNQAISALCAGADIFYVGKKDDEEIPGEILEVAGSKIKKELPSPRDHGFKVLELYADDPPFNQPSFLSARERTYPKIPPKVLGRRSQSH